MAFSLEDLITRSPPDALSIVRGKNPDLKNSGVLSGDTAVKSGGGYVHWMTVSDTAALAIELNDSVDNSGTDRWAVDLPADAYAHFIFDPPIKFSNGIYLDVSTATCKVTIGYI